MSAHNIQERELQDVANALQDLKEKLPENVKNHLKKFSLGLLNDLSDNLIRQMVHKIYNPLTLFALSQSSIRLKTILEDEVDSLHFGVDGYISKETTPLILAQFPKLRYLSLIDYSRSSEMTDEFLNQIFIYCSGVKILHLEPFAAKDCSILQQCISLEELHIVQSMIADFSDLKNLKQLKQLDLSRCWILENLAGLEELNTLKVLTISYCQSFTSVAPIEKFSEIEWLYLLYNEKLKYIENLAKCPRLKEVYMLGCKNVDPQVINSLKKMHLKLMT